MLAQLSGGQRQRAWFAMALAQSTDTMFLDEFTNHLDIRYQLDMLHLMRRLNQQKGVTVLLVLHDVNQALNFCDEIMVMKQGRLLAQGAVRDMVTERLLKEAFDVDVSIKQWAGTQKYCIFYKRETNDDFQ
jgi:iron complex transport system ATP-binding protein